MLSTAVFLLTVTFVSVATAPLLISMPPPTARLSLPTAWLFTILGGTGRFDGASGTFNGTGVSDATTRPTHVSIDFAVDRSRADFVIVGDDVFESGLVRRRVLEEGPQVRVLAVRPDGGQTTLHRLRPEQIELGELSLECLVEVMAGGADDAASATVAT